MSIRPIIAIDGPVGVGKSSVAIDLARELGFLYIDSGAMYRAITLKAMKTGVELLNRDAVGELASQTDIQFVRREGDLRILCDGEDVSDEIRLPEVSRNTSPVADNVVVRQRLVARQQEMGQEGNVIMEGRDIGTVVFPHADIKFYLDAKAEVRAERRYRQLIDAGKTVSYEETLHDLNERDRCDRERPVGALQIADGAIVVDSTTMSQEDVVNHMCELVRSYIRKHSER